jgi:hypothetical protein
LRAWGVTGSSAVPPTAGNFSGLARARLARDAYNYAHLVMIAGIVLFAFGLETTLEHVDDALDLVPAFGL